MPHQANILYDVFGDGRHLIAKEFLSDMDLDSPLNEYRALRLVEPLDMAPRPVFFDPDVGQVVVYEFLEGVMWDRRVPSAAALAALADRWVELHALTIDGCGSDAARHATRRILSGACGHPSSAMWPGLPAVTPHGAWRRTRVCRRWSGDWRTACRSSLTWRRCVFVDQMRGLPT
jgi:hypothetical protein